MKKPYYQQSFYTTPIFVIPTFIGLLLVIGLFSSVAKAFSAKGEIIHANTNFCQLATLSALSVKYGVNYKIDEGFDIPAIKLIGDNALIQKVYQDYNKRYPKDTISSATTQQPTQDLPQQCHLANARYHVNSVNPRLAPLIPTDVDYVSYAPKADKAMYCYYHLSTNERKSGENNHSQCFFLQIKNEYGTEWLIKDDISDLENANLVWAKENYQLVKNQTTLNNVYTYVYSWNDNPSLMYGFTLSTNFNGTRWLAGGTY